MRSRPSTALAAVLLASAVRLAAQPPAAPAAADRAAPVVRDVPLSPAARARYVGHFTLADSAGAGSTSLRVFEEHGALLGQLRANTPSRLVYEGRDTFHPADAADFRLVFTVSGGHATRVRLDGPNLALRGDRDAEAGPRVAAPAADSSQAGALYDELARADSLLFDASYVRCDTARVYALLADDVEFYHDVTGLHRGAEVRADFARLARNCPRDRGVRRELVPGSLRVYPIHDFGAAQAGTHRFVERGAATATEARFVHVWRKDGGAWRATRILSLDHHAVPAP